MIHHLPKPGPDGRSGSEQIPVPGAVQPCSRQGVRRAAKVHWTFGPDSPTTAPTPPPLLRRAGPQRPPACCRHRPGTRGGSRAAHASANLRRGTASLRCPLSPGDAAAAHLRGVPLDLPNLRGANAHRPLYHRSAYSSADPRLPIGEPAMPPRIAPARGPPSWEQDDSGHIFLDQDGFPGDPLAQPEPEYEFDQRMTW